MYNVEICKLYFVIVHLVLMTFDVYYPYSLYIIYVAAI